MIRNNQYQGVTFLVAPFFISCREIFDIFLGAISGYPQQSFAPNNGTKGFKLLSGLWQPTHNKP